MCPTVCPSIKQLLDELRWKGFALGFHRLKILTLPPSTHILPGGWVVRICLQCRRCQRCRFSLWVGETLWGRKWQPTPVFLPAESNGQRNLAGYSPWGSKESNMTKWLTLLLLSYIRKGSWTNTKNLPYFHQKLPLPIRYYNAKKMPQNHPKIKKCSTIQHFDRPCWWFRW